MIAVSVLVSTQNATARENFHVQRPIISPFMCEMQKRNKLNRNINYSTDFIVSPTNYVYSDASLIIFVFFFLLLWLFLLLLLLLLLCPFSAHTFSDRCLIFSRPRATEAITMNWKKKQIDWEERMRAREREEIAKSHLLSGNPNMIYCITSRGLFFSLSMLAEIRTILYNDRLRSVAKM